MIGAIAFVIVVGVTLLFYACLVVNSRIDG